VDEGHECDEHSLKLLEAELDDVIHKLMHQAESFECPLTEVRCTAALAPRAGTGKIRGDW
jgi:hypothetical protein